MQPGSKPENKFVQPTDVKSVLAMAKKPKKVVVTAGMPYANGPLHLGHLAGAHVPADIYARWMRMLIGAENVLFVNGNDDHGSTSEVAAVKAGKSIREFIDTIHEQQKDTLKKYSIQTDVFTGTSRPETYPLHEAYSQDFLRRLYKNGALEKRVTKQWFDSKMNRFLQDRFVRGTCPNCGNTEAYSDECDACGTQFDPSQLKDPRSQLSDAIPELKDTAHWWLNMWKTADPLKTWIETKQKAWRAGVVQEVINTVLIGCRFENQFEDKYKTIKDTLPKHKSRYVAGKKVECLFDSKADLAKAQGTLEAAGIPSVATDKWAYRPITRDVSWGIPVPPEIDPEMKGKTLYVWPDSLIAPIVFTQVALEKSGRSKDLYKEFWCDPEATVVQFLGQDNVFFYVIMQGSMWLGQQEHPLQLPQKGDLQMTEILSVFHLMVNGEKMSKSKGNFYTGDQLLEMGYSNDQVRYFLALLSLPVKASNFDFEHFAERNKFLAGPMNAALEKPLSACISKFNGIVPEGKLIGKAEAETVKLVQMYLRSMQKGDYAILLGQIENYARQVNSLFTQYKPHDDRAPGAERKDALFTCFYVLKNLMIMLAPFVPDTMNEVRKSLNLPESVFRAEELGTGIPAGHKINPKGVFFPAVAEEAPAN
ncbi:methionine--tRNA ligase [Bdellovibrio bacteriovorus]|uniref:Methionine--tRNA ligase n=1 Tax=Bdellovibrio bacteriovorus TaxID=959 RepID=A0A150WMP5_BDEBC|nr:class I tRNA ligase family protein [Bdellovibrio bacteriovorus]KYG65761.1 methionine--tRNA ligase [Bdellovibrio bacteriovorus]